MTSHSEQDPGIQITSLLNQFLAVCREGELQVARELGISIGELRCLRLFLDEHQHSVKELTNLLRISSSRLSRILERLEEHGMINRTIDPKDRRSIVVMVTPKGSDFARSLNTNLILVHKPDLEGLPTQSLETTVRVLRHVLDSVSQRMQTRQSRGFLSKTSRIENALD